MVYSRYWSYVWVFGFFLYVQVYLNLIFIIVNVVYCNSNALIYINNN